MSEIGESIIRGLEQALAFAEGTADMSLYRVHIPPEIDVRAIRGRLGLTQQEFAVRFGFNINTLRHWEPGAPGLDFETGERPDTKCHAPHHFRSEYQNVSTFGLACITM